MNNVADIKPWFRDDLERVLAGVYFAAQHGVSDRGVRLGIALTLSALCVVLGIKPESILSPEDVQLLKSR